MTDKTEDELAEALKAKPDPKLDGQGGIAADDAGATAMAEHVTEFAGIQSKEGDEYIADNLANRAAQDRAPINVNEAHEIA